MLDPGFRHQALQMDLDLELELDLKLVRPDPDLELDQVLGDLQLADSFRNLHISRLLLLKA